MKTCTFCIAVAGFVLGALLAQCAHADELLVNIDGTQTYYVGSMRMETDVAVGEIELTTSQPPMTNGTDDTPPAVTGAWHVTVVPGLPVPKTNARTEWVRQCAATTAYAAGHGMRVVLTCVGEGA